MGRRRPAVRSMLRLKAPPMSVRSTIMTGMVTAHSGTRNSGPITTIADTAITKYWMQPSSSSRPNIGPCSWRSIGSHSGLRPAIACSVPQVRQIEVAALRTRPTRPASNPRLRMFITRETAPKITATVKKAAKLSRARV